MNVLVRLASVKMNTASGSQVSHDTLTETVATALSPIPRYVLCFISVLSTSHPVLILVFSTNSTTAKVHQMQIKAVQGKINAMRLPDELVCR